MSDWLGADDDFLGEIGADDDLAGLDIAGLDIAGSGTEEIVGAGDDAQLLKALSIGAARSGQTVKARRLARIASRVATYRKVDPNAVVVRDRSLDKRRRFPLGFVPTTVAAATVSIIPAAPQDLFRPERLVIPSDIAFDFGVQDVKVGNTSQLVSGGEVPGSIFTEVAIDTHVHFKTAEIGNQISISARNKTAAAIEFSAGVIGTTLQA